MEARRRGRWWVKKEPPLSYGMRRRRERGSQAPVASHPMSLDQKRGAKKTRERTRSGRSTQPRCIRCRKSRSTTSSSSAAAAGVWSLSQGFRYIHPSKEERQKETISVSASLSLSLCILAFLCISLCLSLSASAPM